jgi:hypothetical protein
MSAPEAEIRTGGEVRLRYFVILNFFQQQQPLLRAYLSGLKVAWTRTGTTHRTRGDLN